MREVVISGSGVFTPPEVITNEELVAAFNAFADKHNALHADAIAAGEREAIPHSDVDFIVKASGIDRHLGHDPRLVIGTLTQRRMHDVRIKDADLVHHVTPLDPRRLHDEVDVGLGDRLAFASGNGVRVLCVFFVGEGVEGLHQFRVSDHLRRGEHPRTADDNLTHVGDHGAEP